MPRSNKNVASLLNRKYSPKIIKSIIIGLMISLSLSACTLLEPTPEPVVASPPPPPPPVKPELSSEPLVDASEVEKRFAQAALKKLGFNVGLVDGIWGPRSATAIRQFELAYQLDTANGHLSELNLTRLKEATNIQQEEIELSVTNARKTGIQAKLDTQIPLSESPQLIITDQAYTILAKPNPYSEIATQLAEGAGLYVINLQDGWYQVESLDRVRGYIKE